MKRINYWTERQKSGRKAERKFIKSCENRRLLCVKSNDLLHYLVYKKIPPYAIAMESSRYCYHIKSISEYLSNKTKGILKRSVRKKDIRTSTYGFGYLIAKGMPDFAVYDKKQKKFYFAEIKAPKAKLRKHQRICIGKLSRNNIKTFIIYPNKIGRWTQMSIVI